jgi:hypothetical protein
MGMIDPTRSPGESLQYDRAHLENIFRRNLTEISDAVTRNYVVAVLMKHIQGTGFGIISSDEPLSVRMDKLWSSSSRAAAYDGFRNAGDDILWLCGFCPGNLVKDKTPRGTKQIMGMGLHWYVGKGKDSYNAALYLANDMRLGRDITATLSRVSDNFEICSRAMLEMKVRFNQGSAVVRPEVLEEISEVFYNGKDAATRLAEIAGREKPALYPVDN